MNFPDLWISWIRTCLNFSSFSIIVNGTPSPWFSFSRGVRQGDPISSYLFILISQNLTSMLNFVFRSNMIPAFDCNLRSNFSHLMFADDLVLVSYASRCATHNIKILLSIYAQLTGQSLNPSKSQTYFPFRFNKRVSRSICSICPSVLLLFL